MVPVMRCSACVVCFGLYRRKNSLFGDCKGGAADPCSFLARGRGPPDRGNLVDAPQCFRARFPPPPIWRKTRSEESCLDFSQLEQSWSSVEEDWLHEMVKYVGI